MEASLLNFELQYFLKMAKAKTFLSAAESLGISQPALGRAIDRLEEKLGFKVFRRSRSGIELTEQGAELLARTKAVSEDLGSILKNIRDRSSEVQGEMRIGGHQSILQDFLLPIYPQLVAQFPLIHFHLEAKSSRETVLGILERNLDLGIVANPIEYNQLLIRTLGSAKGFFYSETKEPAKFFLNPQMIDLNKLLRVLKKRFLNETNIHFINDYDLIAQMVKDKLGCGLLPDHVGKRFGLKINTELSTHFKLNFDLRLVVTSDYLDDKKRKVLRFLENEIRRQS